MSDPRWLDEPVPPQPQLPGQPKLGPSCLEPQQLPLIPTSFCGHCGNVKATSGLPLRVPRVSGGASLSLASAIFGLSAVGGVWGELEYLLVRASQMAGLGCQFTETGEAQSAVKTPQLLVCTPGGPQTWVWFVCGTRGHTVLQSSCSLAGHQAVRPWPVAHPPWPVCPCGHATRIPTSPRFAYPSDWGLFNKTNAK